VAGLQLDAALAVRVGPAASDRHQEQTEQKQE
jgi:hypothetical protein